MLAAEVRIHGAAVEKKSVVKVRHKENPGIYMRRFTSTATARRARVSNRAISNSFL